MSEYSLTTMQKVATHASLNFLKHFYLQKNPHNFKYLELQWI